MARSEYFREMFSSSSWKEALTNEVDLRSDSEVDGSSLRSLCLFLMTETFHAQGDLQLALSVRRLADRYRLDSLVKRAETELYRLLSTDNALTVLAHVTGCGGKLEEACLICITADNCDLLEKQQDKLDTIAEENPELMKQLVRLLLKARGKRPRTE
ncbi:unnamed protein product [Symbiodinium natans]|uniref:BTB domain-containing protein n=1 Tax=Symbiodinium natans TaxID=878477 RepID=A0A812GJZ4_9DINO|nr:unnamed protein product [Symbiodinium natans]